VSFNIIGIRTHESNDGRLYPLVGDSYTPIEFEEHDGEPVWVTASALSVGEVAGGGIRNVAKMKDTKIDVMISDARLALACSKFDKGSTWWGIGGGGATAALVFTAVSKARAAHRRKGKLLMGQVRYPWLKNVGFTSKRDWKTNETIRLNLIENTSGTDRELVLDLILPKNVDACEVARAIAQRAARYRLDFTDVPDDRRERFEALVTCGPIAPEIGRFAMYRLPTFFKANASTAIPSQPRLPHSVEA
jgi:hypothetical protein